MNKIKSIPFLDKIVNNLIRIYFNLKTKNIKKNIFKRKHSLPKHISSNKIFVSKAEIKHSNEKIIVNLYTYNQTKKYFMNKLSKLHIKIFTSKFTYAS
jgi:hypothetical protein